MSGSAGARGVLGNITNMRGPDLALLRPGIKTNVTGIKQVLQALEKGSKEVRKYLLEEVNVVYECKVCMNFFRSLANLTAHKRSYCLEQHCEVQHIFDTKAGVEAAQLQTVVVQAEQVDAVFPESQWDVANYSPSLELLKDAGIIKDIEERPLVNRLLPVGRKGLQSVVERLAAKAGVEHRAQVVEGLSHTDGLCLEPIKQTSQAHFQSWTTGFEYREVQALNNREATVAVGPNGRQLPRGDMNGALKRACSPTSSDSSKENIEEEDNNNMGGTTRYPCPECKKSFTKMVNVYKHLAAQHNKTKEQYMKLTKVIRNNAFIEEKVDPEIEDIPPKVIFTKNKQQEDALQLAMAVGLVGRNGVGMQKVNNKHVGRPRKNPLETDNDERRNGDFSCDICGYISISEKGLAIHKGGGKCKRSVNEDFPMSRENKNPLENENDQRRTGDFSCDICGFISISDKGLAIHRGLGKCKRNVKEDVPTPRENKMPERVIEDCDSDDSEVTFSPRQEKDLPAGEAGAPERKRKRVELTTITESNGVKSGNHAWDAGQFACQLCDKTFRTATFLLQHYVTPHFKEELKREFATDLVNKKCPTCMTLFDNEAKLMMHLGATHREVNKYLPVGVAAPAVSFTKSPTKKITPSTVANPMQKFLETAVMRTAATGLRTPAALRNPTPELNALLTPKTTQAIGPKHPTINGNNLPPAEKTSPKMANGVTETPTPLGKRPLGRPPGSPNKPKILPAGSPPIKTPPPKISDFMCPCGYAAASERGLNIHRGLAKCKLGKSLPPENQDALQGILEPQEFRCACGFESLSERGLNIHKCRCTSPKLQAENQEVRRQTPDALQGVLEPQEFRCPCGFESLSERGLNIHKCRCTSPKLQAAASSAKWSPKARNVPEIEDEFMT